MHKNKGFSLIELMIVVAIMGILVAIILPSYQTYIRRAHYIEIVQATIPYKMSIQECFQVTNELSECGSGQQGVIAGKNTTQGLIQSIQIDNEGKITVIPESKYGFTADDDYVLTPTIKQGQLLWTSGGGGVAHGYTN